MKILLFLCIYFLIQPFAFAFTLKAGISYTVESARVKAFNNTPLSINMDKYQNYFNDPYHIENISAIKIKKYKLKNRYLTYFSDKQYGVTYKNNTKVGFYYDLNGKLCDISLLINKDYPIKIVKYDTDGKLISTSLAVSRNESFVFDLNKKLISHWIKNNCYNENGELVKTRSN